MDYVCDHMKKTVIYDQDTISVTLTRCGRCIGCYCLKAEMPMHSCATVEELGKLLSQAGFEEARVIIEGLRK